jgi:hypothetical protein
MMRIAVWLTLMLTSWMGLTVAQAASAEPDPVRVAALVKQLGAPRFIERQMATESLSSMGLAVAGPIKAAVDDPDPEVRFRARQILRVIRHVDRQRLINAFIDGVDVDADAQLPGWQQFQQIAGHEGNPRQLYVAMLEDEWEFLDEVYQNDPQVASGLVAARIMSLEVASRTKRPVSVGSIAALLLVASREDVELANHANLMSLCYRSTEFDAAIRTGQAKESLRALLGHLISRGSDGPADPYLTQRFHFSLYYDLKEGLGPARQVVSERLGIPHVRQYALLVLGKLGDEHDEQLIENLLDDPGVVTSHHPVNGKRITTQVRDIALAVLIHRHGRKFADYGLGEIKQNPTTLLQLTTVGFVSDEERERAIQLWNKTQAESQ